jgi:predicted transcriptional regulator
LSIDEELAAKLKDSPAFRRRYIRFFAQNEVAAEIRGLRKKRGLLQAEVAEKAHTGQSAISRIEGADYDGWTFKTLIGIAEALDARLRITFEPIEEVVSDYLHTNFEMSVPENVGDTTPESVGEVPVDTGEGVDLFSGFSTETADYHVQ